MKYRHCKLERTVMVKLRSISKQIAVEEVKREAHVRKGNALDAYPAAAKHSELYAELVDRVMEVGEELLDEGHCITDWSTSTAFHTITFETDEPKGYDEDD